MIKKLIKDRTDCYLQVGNSRLYMSGTQDRKPVTNDTQTLSFREICLKLDEIIDYLNAQGER